MGMVPTNSVVYAEQLSNEHLVVTGPKDDSGCNTYNCNYDYERLRFVKPKIAKSNTRDSCVSVCIH